MVEACIAGGLQDLLKHLGGLSFDFRFSSFLAVKDSIQGLACFFLLFCYFDPHLFSLLLPSFFLQMGYFQNTRGLETKMQAFYRIMVMDKPIKSFFVKAPCRKLF